MHDLLDANTENNHTVSINSTSVRVKCKGTYALPITPYISFTIEPFSLSLEKKPGLGSSIILVKLVFQYELATTYIPRNFFDFMNVVAFMI